MASFNKIVIVGYLGREAEMRYLPDSTAVANLSVATTEKRKDKGGEPQEFTTWFRVTVWGKQAELCAKYTGKGSQVYIEGRLSQQEYTDRDGNKRTSLEVRASDVQFLDWKPQGDDQQSRPRVAAATASHQERGFGANDPSDIPF